MFELIIQVIANGIMSGMVYVLVALGFTLIFGVMRVVNFAHGEFYMLAAFATYILVERAGVNYFLAIPLVAAMVGLFGVLIERALFRPLLGKELNVMIMSFAISITLQAGALVAFGSEDFHVAGRNYGSVRIGDVALPGDRLMIVVAALVILTLFYLLMKHTKLGLAMRAVAQDGEIAGVFGIRVSVIHSVAFGVGSVLAALAGALMAPLYPVTPYMGELPMLRAFVVVILGGLGSIPGAIVGGLIIGLVESVFSTLANTVVATIVSFAIVIVIIVLRPQGLFGKALS